MLTSWKPAVVEKRKSQIEFRVANDDGTRESTIILAGLKNLFHRQLPGMPKGYIARLVYDRTHLSLAILRMPLEVISGTTNRDFQNREFAEIVLTANNPALCDVDEPQNYGLFCMEMPSTS
jgi:histone acetyltransferase